MTTTGTPGIETPQTLTPGAVQCIAYQRDGAGSIRCGSLARSGLPVTERDESTAHALLPASGRPRPNISRYDRTTSLTALSEEPARAASGVWTITGRSSPHPGRISCSFSGG